MNERGPMPGDLNPTAQDAITKREAEYMTSEQVKDSNDRFRFTVMHGNQLARMQITFKAEVEKELDHFEKRMAGIIELSENAGVAPSESLDRDIEQFDRIKSEILQKIKELGKLRFGKPE